MPARRPYKTAHRPVGLDWALDLTPTGPTGAHRGLLMATGVAGRVAVVMSLCCLCWSLRVQGHPLRKRSISEVQLMHNVREHKQVAERQDWLQVKLKNILSPSPNDSQKGQRGKHRTLSSLQHDRLT
ncbi:parathyroid hormone 1b [Sardina pilchardus]|uniref:parathyroid hormone 1b n=1 Tax=Sardina pilchardus TaxID=27697 RepID=UPI002E122C03